MSDADALDPDQALRDILQPDRAQREILQRWLALSPRERLDQIRVHQRDVAAAAWPHTPERRTGRGRRQFDQEA